jgi:hypothetical protein
MDKYKKLKTNLDKEVEKFDQLVLSKDISGGKSKRELQDSLKMTINQLM